MGRVQEVVEAAWSAFENCPGPDRYNELLAWVPEAEHAVWRGKAMDVAERGNLAGAIELWLSLDETNRLVARLKRSTDEELEALSHYVTEPAAEHLANSHPEAAARVFRALCVRILNAGKSRYYFAALAHLENALRCYHKAGMMREWQALEAEIRLRHRRKSGFMPGLNRISRLALALGAARRSPR